MKEFWKRITDKYGYPKVLITIFLIILCIIAVIQQQNLPGLLKDSLVRIGMNGVLVLAMVPSINSGTGLNFGLSIGILCGILAGCISIELKLTGMTALIAAILMSIPFSVIAGYLYGLLLNRVKGDEMTVGTYMGFSIVSLMCIGWLLLPFQSPDMIWAIGGKGLRTTIALADKFGKVLDDFLSFNVLGEPVPTGSLLFFGLMCVIVWLFFKTKTGVAMIAAGDNAKFAAANGINVNQQRVIGTILSMVLGGIGIVIYAQSFGFFQLYTGPLMMPFMAVSAVLIGGASAKKANIANVVSGTTLFFALLAISLPVINKMMPEGNLSEVIRIIVTYGVILYALTKVGGDN
ncbi:ABC transporter permease subunit [Lutispora thermophila]|uniref:Monosaccharide ABC transporter membrane protein, CUT2 family (TC 3.A.1.2.-) n=1 Tax=Lutispora thermophila DSM 19022 TaxID=1122184 RepID=A0A1M6GNM0_9FIRM|nr:ABC transporter [Lutispora thermophila]SHJ11529.1 monosaccharide ABC transporter membrane protein, CUT2 family (TC 3.A.1.2.-) [Lutispora thermophila DSM 19022]